MPNEPSPGDLRNLWQSQTPEPAPVSVEEIRAKAGKFQRTIHWRNMREYAACAFVVVWYGLYLKWYPKPLMRAGSAMIIGAAVYIAYHLYRHGSSRRAPADCAFESCVAFHRRELERQRDLLSGIWKWYLGPLIPGLAVFLAGTVKPGTWAHSVGMYAAAFLPCALVFFGIGKLNQRAARKLQQRIDELDALERQS